MSVSKNKAFTLDHCWKILQHSEKWKLSLLEPNKKNEIHIEDDEEENGERNMKKPEGNKRAKLKVMEEAEAASLREKLDQMVNVVSWESDTGSKGYPLFRFGTGREGG